MPLCVRHVGRRFGWRNIHTATDANRAYRAMETVGSAVIWNLVREIQRRCGAVPMAYVHDGVLVHRNVNPGEIMGAFADVTARLGLPGLQLAAKDWGTCSSWPGAK